MDLDANRSLIAAALARIPGGDRAALQTVYRLTSAKLFGVALRILGDRGEAEDVLQEVYVTVWRKAADFDPARASPMTWLIAIARNRAIDRLRATPPEPAHGADRGRRRSSRRRACRRRALESAQDHARLHGCLDELADAERAALRGAFFDGNTYEELAARMNVPLGTMKSWIRRAMIKLKACLEQ